MPVTTEKPFFVSVATEKPNYREQVLSIQTSAFAHPPASPLRPVMMPHPSRAGHGVSSLRVLPAPLSRTRMTDVVLCLTARRVRPPSCRRRTNANKIQEGRFSSRARLQPLRPAATSGRRRGSATTAGAPNGTEHAAPQQQPTRRRSNHPYRRQHHLRQSSPRPGCRRILRRFRRFRPREALGERRGSRQGWWAGGAPANRNGRSGCDAKATEAAAAGRAAVRRNGRQSPSL